MAEQKTDRRHKIKLATLVESDPQVPFSIATKSSGRGGRYFSPWIASLIIDPYLIMLSIKQGVIKYHFLGLWYDSTWD